MAESLGLELTLVEFGSRSRGSETTAGVAALGGDWRLRVCTERAHEAPALLVLAGMACFTAVTLAFCSEGGGWCAMFLAVVALYLFGNGVEFLGANITCREGWLRARYTGLPGVIVSPASRDVRCDEVQSICVERRERLDEDGDALADDFLVVARLTDRTAQLHAFAKEGDAQSVAAILRRQLCIP